MPLQDGNRLGQEGLVGIGRGQVNDPAMAGKEVRLPIKCACGNEEASRGIIRFAELRAPDLDWIMTTVKTSEASGWEQDERRMRGGRSRRVRRLL
jgi:hypothetical protein